LGHKTIGVISIGRGLDSDMAGGIIGVIGFDLILLIEPIIDVFGGSILGSCAIVFNGLLDIAKPIIRCESDNTIGGHGVGYSA